MQSRRAVEPHDAAALPASAAAHGRTHQQEAAPQSRRQELERNVDDRLGGLLSADEPRQPVNIKGITDTTSAKYFTCLNMAMEEYDGIIFGGVQGVAAALSLSCPELEFHAGPAKKRDRAYQKAGLAYNRDYSQLKDLRRASIICPDVKTLIKLLLALIDADIDICRVSSSILSTHTFFRFVYIYGLLPGLNGA